MNMKHVGVASMLALSMNATAAGLTADEINEAFESNIQNVCISNDFCKRNARSGAVILSILSAHDNSLKNFRMDVQDQTTDLIAKYRSCDAAKDAYFNDEFETISQGVALALAAELLCKRG